MTEIKLDFDRPSLPRDLRARIGLAANVQRLRVEYIGYERTRRGWHVRVGVRGRLSFMRVVALQAILGSDWKRELFNSRRAIAWRHVPGFWRARANVFYERHYRGISLQ